MNPQRSRLLGSDEALPDDVGSDSSANAPARSPSERIVCGGRVVAIPSPDGIVRIVGIADSGEWVAEFICRAPDLEEKHVRNMEAFVAEKTAVRLAIVG